MNESEMTRLIHQNAQRLIDLGNVNMKLKGEIERCDNLIASKDSYAETLRHAIGELTEENESLDARINEIENALGAAEAFVLDTPHLDNCKFNGSDTKLNNCTCGLWTIREIIKAALKQ